MIVRARPRDTSTATVSVVARAAKNCSTTPWSSPNGRNTTTVVIVDVVTGQMSSWTAARIAGRRSPGSARWRAMRSEERRVGKEGRAGGGGGGCKRNRRNREDGGR